MFTWWFPIETEKISDLDVCMVEIYPKQRKSSKYLHINI